MAYGGAGPPRRLHGTHCAATHVLCGRSYIPCRNPCMSLTRACPAHQLRGLHVEIAGPSFLFFVCLRMCRAAPCTDVFVLFDDALFFCQPRFDDALFFFPNLGLGSLAHLLRRRCPLCSGGVVPGTNTGQLNLDLLCLISACIHASNSQSSTFYYHCSSAGLLAMLLCVCVSCTSFLCICQ